MNVILFEDETTEQLNPAALGRPAFGITCGCFRLIDLIAPLAEALAYVVRPHLRAIVAADFPARGGSTTTLAIAPERLRHFDLETGELL